MAYFSYIYNMLQLTETEHKTLANFCQIVDDVSHFLKKTNRHYPIRKKFLTFKVNLVRFLYINNYVVSCKEFIQVNENVEDKEPYVLVQMEFLVAGKIFTFYTPKKNIKFEYILSERKIELTNILPQRLVHFEMEQCLKILKYLKLFDIVSFGYQTPSVSRRIKNLLSQLNIFLDWKTSDKLRAANKNTGIFDNF